MRKPVIYAAIALFAASTGIALGEDADTPFHRTPRTGAMAQDQIKRQIEVLGYDLGSFELDDGVFKARIVDRESGLPVKAKFDTVTGELLRAAPGSR
ncbi:PepSY domain-containing protein [Bradyrhizobium sp. CCBAU 45384]|uniref:PepSY domain-containing protein n=1 Tax=Bradyrhizobium sp. CCBAU 45384 TaxID=858428 RepID=UPI002305B214|nr:PepSY domain-containing protein [Bradyrhizobium sp. CCBAU 45384]MDA9408148.1 hypothetical protein [Bradyrhizobium sp. CCBAU 45384]